MAPLCVECYHSSKLTVVRNIHFSVPILRLVQRAVFSCGAESVILLCAACNDVSEHVYFVCSSVSVDVKNKKNPE